MHDPNDTIGRKRPAQGVVITLDQPTIVFVTVCTKGRERWLTQAAVHAALRETWTKADAWLVGRYVLMPDHLHLFCAPVKLEITLETWITFWKRNFSRRNLSDTGAWQRNAWDRRLRRQESYDEKWEYVRQNPVRAGLAERPEDWPYQGEMNLLRW